MKTRTLLIVLGAVAVVGVLCLGAAVGGVLAYFALQARPAQASSVVQVFQPRQVTTEAGVLVAHVAEGSPAAKAGMARGDILLEINGKAVNTPKELSQAVEALKAGDRVELKVEHGDDQRTLNATLEERDGRPYLGVEACGFPAGAEFFFRGELAKGAVITKVTPGSPAEKAGLKVGDGILSVDGDEVGPEKSLSDLIGAHRPGDTVTLRVSRPGEDERDVQVQLGENPNQPGSAYLGVTFAPGFSKLLPGDKLLPAIPFEGKPLELPDLPEGVTQAAIVGAVGPGSPAEQAGIRVKDFITQVDGKSLDSAQALAEAVQSHKPGDQIALTIFHPGDGESKTVTVTLGEDPDQAGKAYLGIQKLGFIHIQREEK